MESLRAANVSFSFWFCGTWWRTSILATLRVLNRSGSFICDNCGFRFTNRKSFRNHHWQYHRSFSVFCDLCPQSFTIKSSLAIHLKQVHLKLRPYECKICLHKFSSKQSLKTHLLIHGPKIECKICHKLVSNMYHHLKAHEKVKCSVCSKIYSKHNLSSHILRLKHTSK